MFERFTKEAREAVLASASLAAEWGAAKAGPDHLLIAVAAAGGEAARILAGRGVTATDLDAATARPGRRAGLSDDEIAALRTVGIDADEVFRRIEQTFGAGALDDPAASRHPRRPGRVGGPFDPLGKKVIELSLREARALGHREISSAHILLALLRQGVSAPLARVLADHGVSYAVTRESVLRGAA